MSLLFTDASDLHHIAHHIRSHADELRRRASGLAARAGSARWQSHAASAFRDRVHAVCAAQRSCADRLDAAARALERHADRVHAHIQALEHLPGAVAAGGAHLAQRVIHSLGL